MHQPLITFVLRFLRDPAAFEEGLSGPVILLDTQVASTEASAVTEPSVRTATAPGQPTALGGEPAVFVVMKYKNNAFPRGVTVGRTFNNDLVLDHESVSRFHAWFERDEGTGSWALVDSSSKNGTAVDGLALKARKPHVLPKKAVIQFGRVVVEFLSVPAFVAYLGEKARR